MVRRRRDDGTEHRHARAHKRARASKAPELAGPQELCAPSRSGDDDENEARSIQVLRCALWYADRPFRLARVCRPLNDALLSECTDANVRPVFAREFPDHEHWAAVYHAANDNWRGRYRVHCVAVRAMARLFGSGNGCETNASLWPNGTYGLPVWATAAERRAVALFAVTGPQFHAEPQWSTAATRIAAEAIADDDPVVLAAALDRSAEGTVLISRKGNHSCIWTFEQHDRHAKWLSTAIRGQRLAVARILLSHPCSSRVVSFNILSEDGIISAIEDAVQRRRLAILRLLREYGCFRRLHNVVFFCALRCGEDDVDRVRAVLPECAVGTNEQRLGPRQYLRFVLRAVELGYPRVLRMLLQRPERLRLGTVERARIASVAFIAIKMIERNEIASRNSTLAKQRVARVRRLLRQHDML
ncbi:Hypothetical protein UVM_LOCUS290 [uncultured virus]|nr:Hypothetical protein UVM_LOCUS290 [uncultured virus]